jgi:hypothetical protein
MASREAFAAASIELYSRLWAALDQCLTPHPDDTTYQILRLELHLLLNACDTAAWRLLLSSPQRQSLKSVLQEIQLAFDTDTAGIPRLTIVSVQNHLLEAVREHCAPSMPATADEDSRRVNRGSVLG